MAGALSPPFRARRLFWKLFAAFTLATAASFLIGVGYVRINSPNAVVGGDFDAVSQVAEILQTRGEDAARARLAVPPRGGEIALFDTRGNWLAGSRQVTRPASRLTIIAPDGTAYQLLSRPAPGAVINRNVPFITGVLVSLMVSALVAWYLARPLTFLSRGFQDVAAGRLSTRLHPLVGTRRDEIADLTREFDGMAAQLEELMATQERLFHDVSHELRSPLARLEVAVGLLRQSHDVQPVMLERVEREAQRLDHLIGELLTLARLKSGTADLSLAHIDVIDLLTAIVDDANFEAGARHCTVRMEPCGPFVTAADGELLYRAYENMIRNAVKYAPEHTAVEVRPTISGDRLDVSVSDSGPGVPAEMLQAIFEPFKRSESGDGSEVTGFGLGLAIAKFAIERHGGTIAAAEGPGGHGLEMRTTLPRMTASEPGGPVTPA